MRSTVRAPAPIARRTASWLSASPTPRPLIVSSTTTSSIQARTPVGILKAIVTVAFLATAAAAYWLFDVFDANNRLAAAIGVLWNPALVVLLVGEGHLDAVMTLLIVVSLGLTLRGRTAGGLLVQLLGVFTRYVPVLLLPSASDRLMGLPGARWLRAALPHPTYAEIPGDLGHTAIAAPPETAESDFVGKAIRGFLK